jgi:DNA end-binding protein Ku
MARPIWKGALSFGLVSIPVEMYPAEDRKSFSFSMLDKKDLAPVGYKRYNKSTGKEVAWGDIVKGYEYDKDQYVVLSDEDFKKANVKATGTIEIRAFVDADEIPLEYYDTPYYLAPSSRGQKVYALLRETLKATHRVAVAEVVLRSTPHLGVVYPQGKALMFNTLRYQDELRDAGAIDLPAEGLKSAGVTPKEVELAKRLVDDMTEKWDPSQYKNTYHDDLMGRIHEKVKAGQATEITKPSKETEQRTAKVIDLAELLKQSLGKGARKSGDEAPGRKAALHVVPKSSKRSSAKTAEKAAVKRRRA